MEILDSGQRTEFENGFVRDMHEGKGRMDLLPWDAIIELSKHCERGALKYGERNIDLGCPQHSLLDSAMRHLAKYVDGETDEDHLLAGFWNIAWAVHQELKRPDMLNLPRHQKSEESERNKRLEEIRERSRIAKERFDNVSKSVRDAVEVMRELNDKLEVDE